MDYAPLVLEGAEHEALPDSVKAWFKHNEDDGKFYINHPQEHIEKLAVGLKKNRDDLKTEKTKLAEQLSKFTAIAATPDEIIEKLKQIEKAPNVEQLNTEHTKKIDELTKNFSKTEQGYKDEQSFLMGQLSRALVETQAIKAIDEHGGNKKLLLPVVLSNLKLADMGEGESRKFDVQVVGDDGSPRYADAFGTPMSVSDRVAELKKDKDYAAAFSTNSGVGGAGVPARQISAPPQGQNLSPTQKIAAGLEARGR